MRVILAGQKSFGAAVYDMLLEEGHDVVSVWAPPKNTDALTKKISAYPQNGPDLFAFQLDRTPEAVEELDVDLFVAAHSHDFISRRAREATKLGGIGYHPSLLPRHRGRDAVRWTVHMGDPVTGGTVYWLTDNVDGGPVAAQEHVLIPPDADATELWRESLFPMGVKLLRGVLRDLENKRIVEVPQDEVCATWEPSWERPPLHRPDLIQIGAGVNGYEHVVRR